VAIQQGSPAAFTDEKLLDQPNIHKNIQHRLLLY